MTRPSQQGIAACERRLVEALLAVHHACDTVRGPNLPEALSLALGQAARRLGATDIEEAATVLTIHRPGSWEADLVRQLIFDPEMLSD